MTTSVALCTYNGVEFLAKQLDSIIRQTKPVDEIIICDDGSILRLEFRRGDYLFPKSRLTLLCSFTLQNRHLSIISVSLPYQQRKENIL